MAKRKNSTALFEVMAASRAARRQAETDGIRAAAAPAAAAAAASRGAATRSPYAPPPVAPRPRAGLGVSGLVAKAGQWAASLADRVPAAPAAPAARQPSAPVPAADPNDPTAGVTAQSLFARGPAADRPAPPIRAVPLPPIDPAPVAVPAPAFPTNPFGSRPASARRLAAVPTGPAGESRAAAAMRAAAEWIRSARADRSSAAADADGRPSDEAGGPAASAAGRTPRLRPPNRLAIDRDRQQVTVRVRFNTAIIGTFAVLVVVGLAYIVGRRAGTPAPVARGGGTPATSTEIKGGPVAPGALDPKKRSAGKRTPAGEQLAVAGGGVQPSPGAGGAGVTTTTAGSAAFEDAVVAADGTAARQPGLNYFVIESYRPNQVEIAQEVQAHLSASGLPCTIEIGSPATHTVSGYWVLIGTRGFRSIRSPEFKQYKDAIAQAGSRFGQKSKFTGEGSMATKWVGNPASPTVAGE